VVITILGILAGLAVPALKNLGKSNVQLSASRQLLDDLARARQLALSQHTTVYVVFVPGAFWTAPLAPTAWLSLLTPTGMTAATNVLDKQFSGYVLVSLRSVGDQPGQKTPRYLTEWKSLPDGAFIATNKFNLAYAPGLASYLISDPVAAMAYPINSFNYASLFPFPTETNSAGVLLPYIAFNYLGQLTVLTPTGETLASSDELIPLAQGAVAYAANPDKTLQFAFPDAAENPAGNSTNSMFNLIRIDKVTGRASQLHQKIK